jgi:hypothetical protein
LVAGVRGGRSEALSGMTFFHINSNIPSARNSTIPKPEDPFFEFFERERRHALVMASNPAEAFEAVKAMWSRRRTSLRKRRALAKTRDHLARSMHESWRV